MKKIRFLAAACCMLAVFTACEKNEPSDGGIGAKTEGSEKVGNYYAVDLGLTVKWATCNVGANSPDDYGNIYAWGETEPKPIYYGWHIYKWATIATYDGDFYDATMTKYNTESSFGTVDNKTVLDPEDDVATVNWGSKWRMPTQGEWSDLINNCTWTWTTYNGVYGYRITSNFNGNFIFLPATGGFDDDAMYHEEANCGYYWSSSLVSFNPHCAYCMFFTEDDISEYYPYCRFCGQSVRPVLK